MTTILLQEIASFSYLAFFGFAVSSPFLPIFIMWRVASLSAIFFAIGKLIEGPTHWSDQNIGWVIGTALLVIFSCAIALSIVIRLVFSAWRGRLTWMTLSGPRDLFKSALDAVLVISGGGLAGLLLTISFANMLSGTSIGASFDLQISIAAGVVSIALLGYFRTRKGLAIFATLATLSIAAFIGSFQSNSILSTAEALSDGEPWCLATSSFSEQITEVGDLGFFALRKSASYPHLVLWIREEGRLRFAAHWSIRQQRFVPAETKFGGVSACLPVSDYAAALRRGEIEAHIYAVGPATYEVSPELDPRVNTRRISIRSNLLIGPESISPKITERIALIESPSEPPMPDNAMPLSMIPNPNEVRASDLTHPNNLTITGVEETTGQTVILNCLHGPYADELCRVRVFADSVGYEFYLPFDQIRNWSDAALQVTELFEGLRLKK